MLRPDETVAYAPDVRGQDLREAIAWLIAIVACIWLAVIYGLI